MSEILFIVDYFSYVNGQPEGIQTILSLILHGIEMDDCKIAAEILSYDLEPVVVDGNVTTGNIYANCIEHN